MNNQGWVKLHRKLQETSFYKNGNAIRLFIHLLLNVNQKPKKFIWNGKEIELLPGQLITGRNQLSEQTGITPQSIRTALNVLKSTSTLTIKSTNKFSLITIDKWHEYQGSSTSKLTSKLTNEQPTTNQQLTTNNNDKNDKKRETATKEYLLNIPLEDIASIREGTSATKENIITKGKGLYDYCEAKGKKYANYKALLRNSIRTDYPIINLSNNPF